MMNCRTEVGARVLCAWLRKCKVVIGEVKGKSFVRLLEALVDSVLLYGQRCGMLHVDRLIHLFKCSCVVPESFWGWVDCIQEVQLSMK